MTSPPPHPHQDPRNGYPHTRPAPGPTPPGHTPHPAPAYARPTAQPSGYAPLPPVPPAAFGRGYRRTAWVLIWVPVVLMLGAGVLSVALLAYADSDPANNSGAGYLALLLWGVMLVGGPLLLGAFVPGIVMLTRSNRARTVTRVTGFRPPV